MAPVPKNVAARIANAQAKLEKIVGTPGEAGRLDMLRENRAQAIAIWDARINEALADAQALMARISELQMLQKYSFSNTANVPELQQEQDKP